MAIPLIFGGAEEDRTPDLRIANATLSQLSYGPEILESLSWEIVILYFTSETQPGFIGQDHEPL